MRVKIHGSRLGLDELNKKDTKYITMDNFSSRDERNGCMEVNELEGRQARDQGVYVEWTLRVCDVKGTV